MGNKYGHLTHNQHMLKLLGKWVLQKIFKTTCNKVLLTTFLFFIVSCKVKFQKLKTILDISNNFKTRPRCLLIIG